MHTFVDKFDTIFYGRDHRYGSKLTSMWLACVAIPLLGITGTNGHISTLSFAMSPDVANAVTQGPDRQPPNNPVTMKVRVYAVFEGGKRAECPNWNFEGTDHEKASEVYNAFNQLQGYIATWNAPDTLKPLPAKKKKEASRASQRPRPVLGIKAKQPEADDQAGVVIKEVVSGQPAALAGLKTGDVIVGLGDEAIKDFDGLIAALDRRESGDRVSLYIKRDGEKIRVRVLLGSQGTSRSLRALDLPDLPPGLDVGDRP
jgi:S1-C subfamily serine protease